MQGPGTLAVAALPPPPVIWGTTASGQRRSHAPSEWGGGYTIEFSNTERSKSTKPFNSLRNSKITKLVIKNKGTKSKAAKLPKKQAASVTTSITILASSSPR